MRKEEVPHSTVYAEGRLFQGNKSCHVMLYSVHENKDAPRLQHVLDVICKYERSIFLPFPGS